MCRHSVKSLADIKGSKVRASAGGVGLMEALGEVPVAMDGVAATTALQRGTIDCVHGDPQWLEAFGYGDVTKSVFMHPMGIGGPAMVLYLNRTTWTSLTPEEKKAMVRGGAMEARRMPSIRSWSRARRCSPERRRRASRSTLAARRWMTRSRRSHPGSAPPTSRRRRNSGSRMPRRSWPPTSRLQERWRGLSKDIGRDIAKMRDALMARSTTSSTMPGSSKAPPWTAVGRSRLRRPTAGARLPGYVAWSRR